MTVVHLSEEDGGFEPLTVFQAHHGFQDRLLTDSSVAFLIVYRSIGSY